MENEYYKAGWFKRNWKWLTAILVVLAAAAVLAAFWHMQYKYVQTVKAQAVSSAPFHLGKQTATAYLVPIAYTTKPNTQLPCGLGKGTLVYGDYNLVIIQQYFNGKHFKLPIYGIYKADLPAQTFIHGMQDVPYNDQLDIIHLNLADRSSDEALIHQYDTCPQSRVELYGINPGSSQLSAFSFVSKNSGTTQSIMNLNNFSEKNSIISTAPNTISTVEISKLQIGGQLQFDHVTWKLNPGTNTFKETARTTNSQPK